MFLHDYPIHCIGYSQTTVYDEPIRAFGVVRDLHVYTAWLEIGDENQTFSEEFEFDPDQLESVYKNTEQEEK